MVVSACACVPCLQRRPCLSPTRVTVMGSHETNPYFAGSFLTQRVYCGGGRMRVLLFRRRRRRR